MFAEFSTNAAVHHRGVLVPVTQRRSRPGDQSESASLQTVVSTADESEEYTMHECTTHELVFNEQNTLDVYRWTLDRLRNSAYMDSLKYFPPALAHRCIISISIKQGLISGLG